MIKLFITAVLMISTPLLSNDKMDCHEYSINMLKVYAAKNIAVKEVGIQSNYGYVYLIYGVNKPFLLAIVPEVFPEEQLADNAVHVRPLGGCQFKGHNYKIRFMEPKTI